MQNLQTLKISLLNPKQKMVSLEQNFQIHSKPILDQNTIVGPRISFSSDFLSEENFISISLESKKTEYQQEKTHNNNNNSEFEFLSTTNVSNTQRQEQQMVAADELFFEGKLLPFWQIQHSDKLSKITLKTTKTEDSDDDLHTTNISKKVEEKVREREKWFFDDDPSPRPPKCTVLWKELLKLKKQRAVSSLSPSSSSSSSSSSNSLNNVVEKNSNNSSTGSNNQHVKRIKRGLERARSASIRIRPMINVPIVNTSAQQQGKSHNSNNGTGNRSDSLPPLFPLRKGR